MPFENDLALTIAKRLFALRSSPDPKKRDRALSLLAGHLKFQPKTLLTLMAEHLRKSAR